MHVKHARQSRSQNKTSRKSVTQFILNSTLARLCNAKAKRNSLRGGKNPTLLLSQRRADSVIITCCSRDLQNARGRLFGLKDVAFFFTKSRKMTDDVDVEDLLEAPFKKETEKVS